MTKKYKKLAIFGVLLSLTIGRQAMAETKVVGFRLGKSTYNEVKANLPKGVQLEPDEGKLGEYDGPTIVTKGRGYGIDGLLSVMFSFDKKGNLSEVLMMLESHRFDDIRKILSSKYQLIRKYPGLRMVFKAHRDYVDLYHPRDAVKDIPGIYSFAVVYQTGAIHRQWEKLMRQSEMRRKAKDMHEKNELARETAAERDKF
jgi:hypothetical protein